MTNGEQAILYRLQRAESDIQKLDAEKAELRDLNALTEEVRGLRRAVVGFAISIAVSAVVFAFATLQLLGGG